VGRGRTDPAASAADKRTFQRQYEGPAIVAGPSFFWREKGPSHLEKLGEVAKVHGETIAHHCGYLHM